MLSEIFSFCIDYNHDFSIPIFRFGKTSFPIRSPFNCYIILEFVKFSPKIVDSHRFLAKDSNFCVRSSNTENTKWSTPRKARLSWNMIYWRIFAGQLNYFSEIVGEPKAVQNLSEISTISENFNFNILLFLGI